jgi:hypothetical protein
MLWTLLARCTERMDLHHAMEVAFSVRCDLVAGGGYGFGLTPGQFIGLSAIELAESIARENRRRAYLEQQMQIQRELGKDQAEIDALQKQLAEVRNVPSAHQFSWKLMGLHGRAADRHASF